MVKLRNQAAAVYSLLASLWLTSCGDEVQVDNGLRAAVRVANAQFEDRRFPVDITSDAAVPVQLLADGGTSTPPDIVSINSLNNSVVRGTVNKDLRVVVGQGATTVAIGLEGERGYWVTPVSTHSVEFSPALELTATLQFDRTLPVGPARLWFAAADATGHYGAPGSLDLTIRDDVPQAAMVLSLDWTEDMDLDLVVALPDGSTLTNKATRSTAAGANAPRIDLDSNASCVIDAHRSENAIFTAVPSGSYTVYVRLAAACGVPETGWRVRLSRDGQVINTVNGVSYAYETNLPHGGPSGPGRMALHFDIGG
ncbi:MAG: hypothetical protein JWN04_6735 [Myxococcaceae bacterium]|nr:hypothetical protein [Myxococcaceae bacterium]